MVVNNVIIGKRITLGAALGGVANAIAAIKPEYSQVILALVVPVTFVAQIWTVNALGVTTNELKG